MIGIFYDKSGQTFLEQSTALACFKVLELSSRSGNGMLPIFFALCPSRDKDRILLRWCPARNRPAKVADEKFERGKVMQEPVNGTSFGEKESQKIHGNPRFDVVWRGRELFGV